MPDLEQGLQIAEQHTVAGVESGCMSAEREIHEDQDEVPWRVDNRFGWERRMIDEAAERGVFQKNDGCCAVVEVVGIEKGDKHGEKNGSLGEGGGCYKLGGG